MFTCVDFHDSYIVHVFEDPKFFKSQLHLVSPVGLPSLPGNIPVISVDSSLALVTIIDDDGKVLINPLPGYLVDSS